MAARTATSTSRRLVIVESPTKARKIAGYLGEGYVVDASVGHIRDLPQPSELPADMKKGPFGRFAVDVENGFEPYYVVDADKKKKITELKRLLKDADELFLATDDDREGEAIAWHLLETLQPKVPVHRMVFTEITPEAIQRALASTRDIDAHVVDAQETRRILDRLYGYEVSPVLWRKVRAGLSAGRVQSVATRIVVERERERMAFRAAEYWDLTAQVSAARDGSTGEASDQSFRARLTRLDGRRVATGRDFDDTGRLTGDAVVLDGAVATAAAQALDAAETDLGAVVTSVETKPYTRRPAAPFTTSTLQQEASRKLRSNARATMRTAQSLYENGYITYMRTDSTVLSAEAIGAARRQATELYGPEFVPDAPRVYARSKGAQEAHEAIRPAGDSFRTPAQVSGELRGEQFRLYELIWKRTVASQMADARGSTASVRVGAAVPPTPQTQEAGVAGQRAELSASGTVITFRGFMAAYEESRDEERHGAEDAEGRLPQLAEGQAVDLADVLAAGHSTSPPPRYTEASLVKALEQLGIGRPSTYAATISTIADRGYVLHRGSALVPTWLAFAVTRLLEEHFAQLVDYRFTASMEAALDRIQAGQEDRQHWLSGFYYGPLAAGDQGGAEGAGAGAPRPGGAPTPGGAAGEAVPEGLKPLVDGLGDIDARDINSVPIGEGITLRVGRYGPYLEATDEDGEPQRASVPDDVAPDELTPERARELLATQGEGDRPLGTNPATGREVVARSGRFGPYVTEVVEDPPAAEAPAKGRKKAPAAPKPPTASLFKTMQLETLTLDDALRLLSLPRVVGADPEDGAEITAQNGRYGPYLKKGTDSRTLESEDQLFDITLEQALAVYAQPKRGRGRTATPPLRELGDDPVSGKPVVVKDGRFGPYVTDGETNATLRKDDEVESITPERAAELLQEKRDRGPAKKPARKPAAKKPAAKKPAVKKPAATKAASKG